MLLEKLQHSLSLRRTEAIGCPRQNRAVGVADTWDTIRGNGLCILSDAHRISFRIPTGEDIEVFIRRGEEIDTINIVTFRGGKWKPWWTEDIRLLLAFAKAYLDERVTGAWLLHEFDNKLNESYIVGPSADEASKLVQTALTRWKDNERIPKNSPRAYLCQYCPIKRQCDALDLEKGETSDWPDDYRVG